MSAMRTYLIGIAVAGALLAVHGFGVLDLGGFANGLAIMVIVFAILALSANTRAEGPDNG